MKRTLRPGPSHPRLGPLAGCSSSDDGDARHRTRSGRGFDGCWVAVAVRDRQPALLTLSARRDRDDLLRGRVPDLAWFGSAVAVWPSSTRSASTWSAATA